MVKNIFMIVGPDNCGKTELSHALCNLFGWNYFKNKDEWNFFTKKDYDPDVMVKYSTSCILNMLEQINVNGIVLDRSIPCHYAYSKALNRNFDESRLFEFDKKFKDLGAKIILCYKTKYENFEDEFVSQDIQPKVLEYYEDYLTRTSMKFVKVNMDSIDLSIELAQVLQSGILWND